MKQSPQIQSRINSIANDLANGKERGELLVKFGKKWSMSKSAFDRLLRLAKPIAESISNKANKAAEDTYIAEAGNQALNGIRSKQQRILLLQNEVIECMKELYDPSVDNFADFGGGRKNVKKQLTVLEKVKLRQIINQLQAEISKIQGDYAIVPIEGSMTLIWKEEKNYEAKHKK